MVLYEEGVYVTDELEPVVGDEVDGYFGPVDVFLEEEGAIDPLE